MNKNDTTKKTPGNQSAIKTMKILEALANNGASMRLLDIANKTSLNTATALRFVNSLIDSGYIYQETDTQRYILTLKVLTLSSHSNIYNRMKIILRNVLESLAHECNESVCLAVNQGNEILYLDVVDGPSRILKATQRIGHSAPLYCTGVGKLHLLNYTVAEIRNIYKNGMEKLTENTITTLDELNSELAKIETNKWAIDNEECETGLRCLAVPIFGKSGKVIAALSVTGPSGRMTDNRIQEIRDTTLTAANNAANLLGY